MVSSLLVSSTVITSGSAAHHQQPNRKHERETCQSDEIAQKCVDPIGRRVEAGPHLGRGRRGGGAGAG